MLGGAFWGTKVLEVVKKTDRSGLLWKTIKLTRTRRANAKKRISRLRQNEAVLRACAKPPQEYASETSSTTTSGP